MYLAARGHTVGVSRAKLINLRWQSVRAKVGEREKRAEMPWWLEVLVARDENVSRVLVSVPLDQSSGFLPLFHVLQVL
jgi:hypothetical protein